MRNKRSNINPGLRKQLELSSIDDYKQLTIKQVEDYLFNLFIYNLPKS